MRKPLFFVAALVGLLAISAQVRAVSLAPTDDVAATSGSLGTVTVVDFKSVDVDTNAAPTLAGSLKSAVVRESGGTLDFLYQVQLVNSPDAATGFSNNNFRGIGFNGSNAVDVFYLTSAPSLGGLSFVTPTQTAATGDSFVRSAAGDTIRFLFDHANPLGTPAITTPYPTSFNGASYILVVRTDATTYGTSTSGILDGSGATVANFAPTPEPGALALAFIALPLMGGYYLRRHRRQA